MSKNDRLRRLLCIMVACTLIFQFYGIKPSAASSSWKLRYVYGAPTSEYVSCWHASVATTKKTTKATINKVGGGAQIFVYSSNGIASIFSTTGHTDVTTKDKIGKIIKLEVSYTKYGQSSNSPNGSFSY